MKKSFILLFSIILLFSLTLVSAIDLKIEKEVVNDVVISEIAKPAIFNFSITNKGLTDNFEIYSLVGTEMSPKGMFSIASGETKQIEVQVFPDESLKRRPGLITFTYKIRGQNSGIVEDTMTINIVDLKDAFEITAYNLDLESKQAIILIENKVNLDFADIKAKFSSTFFNSEQTLALLALENKEISISLDIEKIKKLVAGEYLMSSSLEFEGVEAEYENIIKFIEKSGIVTTEKTSGILLKQKTIEKTNEGNVPAIAEISISKDAISRLFTTFSADPNKADRKGFTASYSWFKELRPSETLSVTVTTNYLYPFIILLAIIIGLVLIRVYTNSDLILRKRASYIKTKGGEFALKVTITAHARKFVEKIALVDRLPMMMKMHERFGANPPNRISADKRRLEWDIESLQAGEERVFSYVIFSKIGVMGKFELPPTAAIYEKDGKIKETSSNLAFFMNEPRLNDNVPGKKYISD